MANGKQWVELPVFPRRNTVLFINYGKVITKDNNSVFLIYKKGLQSMKNERIDENQNKQGLLTQLLSKKNMIVLNIG